MASGGHSHVNMSDKTENPTERCSIHKSKVIDMYCEYHDVVGCRVCFAKDHKSCLDKHVHSVPDMIDTLFKLSDCKQTLSHLKDMMVSMETHVKSKDKLRALKKAKEETLDQVKACQKALEAMLKKNAESSKNEIEAAYKELEKEILEEKDNAEGIRQDLKMAGDKLKKLEGNRSQHFVCSKIAQEKIEEADGEKNKQHCTDRHVSFMPNQLLMECIKDLQGIGQVQKHVIQKHDYLYRINGYEDINIRLPDDNDECCSMGCCLTHDNQLLVTDRTNEELKLIDLQKMSVVDYCTFDCEPLGVCCISKHEVVVAFSIAYKIQFVSIENELTPTRQIEMSHPCFGIAFKNDRLYVTNNSHSLYVYDMSGTLLNMITCDNDEITPFLHSRHITFNESGNRMFVGDLYHGLVCFDGMANYLHTVAGSDLSYVESACVDGKGNMFIAAWNTRKVIQYSEDGERCGVVVNQDDKSKNPQSVCFLQELNKLFVTFYDSDIIKIYKLK